VRDAPVHAGVVLALAVHHLEEEEAPGGQEDAVSRRGAAAAMHGLLDLGRLRRGGDTQRLAVLPPLDGRLRRALRLAVERGGVVAAHHHVGRVLDDPGRPPVGRRHVVAREVGRVHHQAGQS